MQQIYNNFFLVFMKYPGPELQLHIILFATLFLLQYFSTFRQF